VTGVIEGDDVTLFAGTIEAAAGEKAVVTPINQPSPNSG
jgi:hypothetical protein